MKRVLLYSHPNEPVTHALLANESDVYPISIKKFLDSAVIFDEIDQNNQKIQWSFPDGIEIRNDHENYIINRVFGIPDSLFKDFDENDRRYAQSELRAYLTFSLEAFPCSFGKPSAFGLCGNYYSLPRQWEMVKGSNIKIKIPHYFLGNLSHHFHIPGLVCSQPYSYYSWKPSISNTSFGFIRPEGEPVIACAIEDDVSIAPYHQKFKLPEKIKETILEVNTQIASLFSLKIFEVLFFVKDTELVFGMASNIPSYSCKNPCFEVKVSEYFSKLMK
jgi:hypothetical protein